MGTADWGYTYLQTTRDCLWFDCGLRRGWTLPDPANPLARLWGVRHARWAWYAAVDTYEDWYWSRYGLVSTGYNNWLRYAIRRGWC